MFKKGFRFSKRRPSASMVVATLALFVALSGGAYAAVAIPSNSVGFAQLKSGAVGFRDIANGAVGTRDVANNAISYLKIQPGEIGHARVAQNQIQWRVTGTCTTGGKAVQSITATGGVTCVSTLPTDYTTQGLSEPLTSSSNGTVLATEAVPAGDAAYVTSTPYIQVSGNNGTQTVTVSCSIAAGTATETRDITFDLGKDHEQAAGSIPLSVSAAAGASAQPVAVACDRGYDTGVAPTVQASAGADVIQLGATSTAATQGTSTTVYSTPAPTTPTSTTNTNTTPTTTTTTPTTTTTASTTTTSGT